MQASKKAYSHIGLLIIGIISIALSSIFIKLSSAPAPVMGMYRLYFCLVLISPWMKWRSMGRFLRTLSSKELVLLLLAGLFLGLHFLLWMESLNHTSVASSMILLSLQPVFVMSGSYLFYRIRTAWSAAVALSLAMVGSIVTAWGDVGLSSEALWGDLLSLLGGVAYALYMLTGQNLCKKMPSMMYSFFVFAIGGLLLLGFNLANGIELVQYSGSNWIIFILLAVVPTIFGQMLFNRLLQVMPASTISMAIVGEPVFAIALAGMFLGEPITVFALLGGAMTLIGIGLYFWVVRLPGTPLQQQPSS